MEVIESVPETQEVEGMCKEEGVQFSMETASRLDVFLSTSFFLNDRVQ